jgi:hypothetical protein
MQQRHMTDPSNSFSAYVRPRHPRVVSFSSFPKLPQPRNVSQYSMSRPIPKSASTLRYSAGFVHEDDAHGVLILTYAILNIQPGGSKKWVGASRTRPLFVLGRWLIDWAAVRMNDPLIWTVSVYTCQAMWYQTISAQLTNRKWV